MNLFRSTSGFFTLHSGKRSHWKIDCDALTTEDWKTIAHIIATQIAFRSVVGIAEGGLILAKLLEAYEYRIEGLPILIVDDVLTTGNSMERMRKRVGSNSVGVVLFARGKCPDWVRPIFQYAEIEEKKPIKYTELGDSAEKNWLSADAWMNRGEK